MSLKRSLRPHLARSRLCDDFESEMRVAQRAKAANSNILLGQQA